VNDGVISSLGSAARRRGRWRPAQQAGPMRRIGVLMQMAETGRQGQLRVAAFRPSLEKLGWTDERSHLDVECMRKLATEVVGLRPDCPFRR
jgi:hypothetical protein